MQKNLKAFISRWAMAIALIWQEAVFKVSTTGEFVPQLIILGLFSICYTEVARLLISYIPHRRIQRFVAFVLCILIGVVFCIEYFVYRQFKLFYDPVTVVAGAADAATGFTSQIIGLVFSASGLAHIVAFLVPAIFAGWTTGSPAMGEPAVAQTGQDTHDPKSKLSARFSKRGNAFEQRAYMLRNAAIAYICALLAIYAWGTPSKTYFDQRNFQTSVTNFGLMTAVRLDLSSLLFGGSGVSFTQTPTADDATASTAEDPDSSKADASTAESAKKNDKSKSKKDKGAAKSAKTYGPNMLDIDFDKLAESTDGTWADLDRYVASLTPSSQNDMTGKFKGYNLIFISAEAFSAEAIRKDTTPTLYRMANKGIRFEDYYQFDSAGTTGGECANIFGFLATEGGNSVKITADHNNYMTMGSALNRLGYKGWAFHNNTYTYYGRDLTHNNLGYSEGYMGYGNGMEEWVTWQWPQSDLEMVKGTFDNLYGKKKQEPFNVYYMSVSGHSDYGFDQNAMSKKNWDKVKDLPYSDPVKGYLAANIELDAAMEYLIGRLEKLGMADHTAIVIGADHFPYGLDDDGPLGSLPYTSELYGFDVNTYFERDHNRLIIWSGSLEKEDPITVTSPTTSLDILPTLLNLFGCEWDSRLFPGRDVFSDKPALVFDLSYDWKSDLGTYYGGSGEFVANKGAKIPKDYVETTSADVANRINYCHGVLTSDYYRHVFGDQ